MKREDTHARYREVLRLSREGLTMQTIAERLGLTGQRAYQLLVQARRWEPTSVEHLTAQSPIEALRTHSDVLVGLRRAGLTTVGQVVALSDDDLLRIRGIGSGTLAQIRADLAARYAHAEEP